MVVSFFISVIFRTKGLLKIRLWGGYLYQPKQYKIRLKFSAKHNWVISFLDW